MVRAQPPSPPHPPTHATTPRSDLSCPNSGCKGGVPLRGRLVPGLELMPNLQSLDLTNNALGGPLPVAWGKPGGFPELVEL